MRNGSRAKVAKVAEDDRQRQTQVRMPDALKALIQTYQHQVKEKTGFKISFSVAVRTLLEKGLEAEGIEVPS